ncbi:hypothetical protein NHJ13734_004058 [Beauveria thailandica]
MTFMPAAFVASASAAAAFAITFNTSVLIILGPAVAGLSQHKVHGRQHAMGATGQEHTSNDPQ